MDFEAGDLSNRHSRTIDHAKRIPLLFFSRKLRILSRPRTKTCYFKACNSFLNYCSHGVPTLNPAYLVTEISTQVLDSRPLQLTKPHRFIGTRPAKTLP